VVLSDDASVNWTFTRTTGAIRCANGLHTSRKSRICLGHMARVTMANTCDGNVGNEPMACVCSDIAERRRDRFREPDHESRSTAFMKFGRGWPMRLLKGKVS